jgi:dTDP-4-amino-4,6-dideoxygalactose transaminase
MVRIVPLVKPHLPSLEEIETELRGMLNSGRLTNIGPYSQRFESAVADFLGVSHAVCAASGTTGLCLLLNTLPKGSEVLVPSFTFVATVQSVLWNGLVPVFVDIESDTFTMCPKSAKAALSSRTSAILAVNTFGAPCGIDDLAELAKRARVSLYFDSAHALGATHKGKRLGAFGDAEVFSLSATKLLACGEGGIVTSNNRSLYEALLDRRNYGFRHGSRDCANMGLNGKFTEFGAILGLKGLDSLDARIRRRNELASTYRTRLGAIKGIEFQKVKAGDYSTFKDFVILCDPEKLGLNREELAAHLRGKGIETASYFSPAVHELSYFKNYLQSGSELGRTSLLQERVLSLPIYSDLTEEEVEYVIAAVEDVCNSSGTPMSS